MKKTIFIFLIICFVQSAICQTIQTDRPSAQTESSSTVYKNAFQVEYGIISSFIKNTIDNITFPNSLYRFGISKRVELRISNDLIFSNNFREITIAPFQIGSKIQLIEKDQTELAFLSMLALNNLKAEDRSQFFQNINTKVIGSYKINEKVNIGYTLGHNLNPRKEKNDLNYSLLFSFGASEKLTSFIEFCGYINYIMQMKNNSSFDFGFAYLINNQLQIDLYMGSSLNIKDYFAAIGISYLFLK